MVAREHMVANHSLERVAQQVKERLEAAFEGAKGRVGPQSSAQTPEAPPLPENAPGAAHPGLELDAGPAAPGADPSALRLHAGAFRNCERVLCLGPRGKAFAEALDSLGIGHVAEPEPDRLARGQGEGEQTWVEQRLRSVSRLVAAGGQFDGIYLGALPHVPNIANTGGLFAQLRRLLDPGGYLLVGTENRWGDGVQEQLHDGSMKDALAWEGELLGALQSGGLELAYAGWESGGNEDFMLISRRPGGESLSPERGPVILWQGPQFRCHSLGWVNRNYCLNLLKHLEADLCLQLDGDMVLDSVAHPANFPELLRRAGRSPTRDIDVSVTHFWPPDFSPAPTGHWIHIQAYEIGSMHEEWLPHFRGRIDEVWVYSNHTKDGFVADGIDPEKVVVVRPAIDTGVFNPGAEPLPLIGELTDKRFKFLFCGGTIPRKGIDVAMKAYLNTFSRSDDVCLIVKDMGAKTFYAGVNSSDEVRKLQGDPDLPEIVYLDQTLTEKEMAGLYTACDALIHPYRGEGFGLPVAEAMFCGLPVIVSRGGACDDFCPPDDSYWVDTEVVKCEYGSKTVREPYWLWPSVDSAAEQMRLAYSDPDAASARGERSRQHVSSLLSWEKTGKLIADRIRKVRQKPILRLQ